MTKKYTSITENMITDVGLVMRHVPCATRNDRGGNRRVYPEVKTRRKLIFFFTEIFLSRKKAFIFI